MLMTDSALTMAAGNAADMRQALKQRKEMTEIAFDKLKVENFGLVAPQVP